MITLLNMICKQNRVHILKQMWSHKHIYITFCITALVLTLNSTQVFFLTKKQIIAKITIQRFHKGGKIILRNGAAALYFPLVDAKHEHTQTFITAMF